MTVTITQWIGILIGFIYLPGISSTELTQFCVDTGSNITINCPGQTGRNVMWVREGKENRDVPRFIPLENGSLFLQEAVSDDMGTYRCSVEGYEEFRMRIRVRTPPPPLVNVTVVPSTILALLLWNVNETGGHPIIRFTAQYRSDNDTDEWKAISPNHISPNSRQVEVYKLEPNTTYQFKIWATNLLGKGEVVEVKGTTLCIDSKKELVRHFLEGAEKFDTRMWFLAVGVVMSTLVLLGLGTCFLLYHECRTPSGGDEEEVIELVPNIILNPGYQRNPYIAPDENSNNETAIRLNNNTVIQPRNH